MYVCNGISHYKTRTLDHTFLASNKLITVSNPTENTYSMWLKYSRLADGSGFIVLLPGRQFAGHTENYKAQINRCYTCHWWDNSHVLCILHCDMRYERIWYQLRRIHQTGSSHNGNYEMSPKGMYLLPPSLSTILPP